MDLKCAICVDVFKEPRKLPGCSHSFCGECLLTYISNLKQDSSGLGFPCPVCRKPTPLPGDNEITFKWIQTLDIDSELEIKDKQEKLSEMDDNSCCRCTYLGKQNKLKVYCLTCKEYLCSSCLEIMHARADCATHSVINTNADGNDKPGGLHERALKLMDQFFTCAEHPESPLQFQCELHGDMVCSLCAVKKHRNCESLIELKDLSSKKNLKTQKEDLVRFSENILEHIESIIGVYKESEIESKQEKEKVQTDYQEMKQKIVQLLDNLEGTIFQESVAMAKKLNIECLDQIDELKTLLEKVKLCRYLMQHCLNNISDEHVHITIQNIRKACHDIELKLIQKGPVVMKKGIELKPGTLMNDLLNLGPNEASELANVKVKQTAVTMPSYKQISSEKSFKVAIEGSTSIRSKNCKDHSPTYNGLLYISNEIILLVDSDNGYCCLINGQYQEIASKKYTVKSEMRLNLNFLQYATCLESDLIALSLPTDKKLFFISQDNLSFKGEMVCSRIPKALCAVGSCDIAITWEKPVAFGIISVQGGFYREKSYFTKDQSGRQLKSFDFMAVDRKHQRVIQPCVIDRAAYCFSFEGKPIFAYKNEDLQEPRGVTVNSDGIILVCNETNPGSIHILSQNGHVIKVIKDHCPVYPLAIAFNKDGNCFAVSQKSGTWDKIFFFSFTEEDASTHIG